MNKKTSGLGVVILLFLLLELALSYAACTSANTPEIKAVNYFELAEGELFEHDFSITNMDEKDVSYAYALIDDKLRGVSISDNGILRFMPSDDAIGVFRIAVIAVKNECADTLIISLRIFDKPNIVVLVPVNSSFQTNQTTTTIFRVRAEDKDANDSILYEWFLDSKPINDSFNMSSISFKPGFGLAGVHKISVRVSDLRNLSREKTWNVQISRVNRAPALIYPIPNFLVFKNTATGAYNLNDYFQDPDGGELNFSYRQVIPQFELPGVVYANVSVNIDRTGFVTYNPALDNLGNAYFIFTATDILNLSSESNLVKVDIFGSEKFSNLNQTSTIDFCGDYVCSAVEDCYKCPFDCGQCEEEQQSGCKADWNCTAWSPCMPAGFQTRNCTDLSNCGDNRTKPDEIKRCVYNATCSDGLKNGIEEGVDCGGPCDTCPSCTDEIQNQGEGGVDCGGPCEKSCPSCSDEIKNQNESDIDCGGPCTPCSGGKNCLKNKDCESLRCDQLVCTYPSCDDEIRNQGEDGVDCGGPCEKLCGDCSDGIQNRGEEGVDCGGRCPPCPTCDDSIRNGNERLVDCGGSCRQCNFGDYFQKYMVFFIIFFVILGIIPLFFITYFFFLLANPERARSLYESNVIFAFLVAANRFCEKFRVLRHKKPAISQESAKLFISELTEMSRRHDLPNKNLHEEIVKIYTALIGLPEEYDDNIFNMKLRTSSLPLFLKVLFAGYYKKAEILAMATFVAPEEKIDLITELRFLLAEAAKG